MIEHLSFLWVSEICRTVIDRYSDVSEREHLYEMTKMIAMEQFSVRPKIFACECNEPQFFYG